MRVGLAPFYFEITSLLYFIDREIDQLEKELSVVRGAMGKLLQGINRGRIKT